MKIRPMNLDDYDAVLAVWRSAGLECKPLGRDSKQAVRRQLDAYAPLMIVAEEDNLLIGVAVGSHDHRKGWINRLAVVPEKQGRGVARTLISRLEEEFRLLDIDVCAATIYEDNIASSRLFEKMGFKCMENVRYYSKRTGPQV